MRTSRRLRAVAAFVNFLSYFKSFLKKQKRAERVDGKVFPSRDAERAEYVDFPRFAAFPKQTNHTRLFASKQEKTPALTRILFKKNEKKRYREVSPTLYFFQVTQSRFSTRSPLSAPSSPFSSFRQPSRSTRSPN